ncbi:MAG: hypothetical protein BWY77_00457 [bacterium ADurb.Bin431]|nr:MAG: hypothetical protein BWY77_00457 [bacterium ADurb.Bin431]
MAALAEVEEFAPVADRAAVAVDDERTDAHGVVAVEQILHDIRCADRKGGAQLGQAAIEFGHADARFFSHEELDAGKGEIIVHHRIELVAAQVRLEHLDLVDDLGGEVGLGIDRLDVGAPGLPEGMGDAKGDIQTPAVDAVARIAVPVGVHPAPCGRKDVLPRARDDAIFILAQLGQLDNIGPARITEGGVAGRFCPRGDGEPVAVGRGLAVGDEILKGEAVDAHVVKNPVEDDAHTAAVDLADELEHHPVSGRPLPGGGIDGILAGDDRPVPGGIGPKVGIDVVIGGPVIFVQRGGGENRIEVEGGDAQFLKIIKFFQDAGEVAAVAPPLDIEPDVAAGGLFPGLQLVPVGAPG